MMSIKNLTVNTLKISELTDEKRNENIEFKISLNKLNTKIQKKS